VAGMPNIWSDEWERERDDEEWAADRSTRLPRGEQMGATLYEVPPGKTGGYYHFHHGAEELLVVLRGRPTLREPAGERVLEEGDVVHFPVGPDGAHQLLNRSDEPVRSHGLDPPVARGRRVPGLAAALGDGAHRVAARASAVGHPDAGGIFRRVKALAGR
jgi:quercetin dioxygenase-like cupin family protein